MSRDTFEAAVTDKPRCTRWRHTVHVKPIGCRARDEKRLRDLARSNVGRRLAGTSVRFNAHDICDTAVGSSALGKNDAVALDSTDPPWEQNSEQECALRGSSSTSKACALVSRHPPDLRNPSVYSRTFDAQVVHRRRPRVSQKPASLVARSQKNSPPRQKQGSA